MKDVEIIGMLKSYVQKSLVGVGALKGAPCKIQSITDGDGFHTVKFEWTDNAGTSHTSDMIVNDGSDIASITQDGATITVELSDGTAHEFIVPTVQGPKGDKGDKGDAGEGLPEGGTAGQVLVKESSTDYDMKWSTLNIPSKTSDLTNDSGFITKVVNDLVNYYLKSETYSKTEVDEIVTAIKNSRFEVVATLPTTDIKTNVIYLVPKDPAQTSNVKDEYINLDGTTSGWEKIGDTEIDLSGYVTTQALNTALANYTTTADLTTLLAAKQDTLTFDDAPTKNSNNPVKSGGVYTADANIHEVMGRNGAKNKEPFDIDVVKALNTTGTWTGNSYELNGITFAFADDGKVTVSGTASALCSITISGNYDLNGDYIITGCPSGGGGSTYSLRIYDSSATVVADDVGEGISFTANNLANCRTNIIVRKDAAISTPIVFAPMIRDSKDTDPTYQPYAKTNQQLTAENQTLTNNVDVLFETGVKNICPPYSGSYSANGITYIGNSDGTVTVNGTCSANVGANIRVYLKAGQYKVSGCPSGGSYSTYRIGVTTDSWTLIGTHDHGNGTTITIPSDGYYRINLDLRAGYVANNLVFKPMITDVDTPESDYDHYVPYAKTNQELTRNVIAIDNTRIMYGVENILPNTLESGVAATSVKYTRNSDETISVSGSAVGNAVLAIGKITGLTKVRLTGCPSGGGGSAYQIQPKDLTDNTYPFLGDYGEGRNYTLDPTHVYRMDIVIREGYSISGTKLFKPMVVDLSAYSGTTYDDYVPYAKSNRELTEDTASAIANVPNGAINLAKPNSAGTTTVSNVEFVIDSEGKVTANGTASANIRFDMAEVTLKAGRTYKICEPSSLQARRPFNPETYRCYARIKSSGVWVLQNNGWKGSYTPTEDVVVSVGIAMQSGNEVTDEIFAPMIVLVGTDVGDTFYPYAMTNRELTKDVISLDAMYDGKTPSAVSDLNVPLTAGGASVAITRHLNNTTNAPTNGGGLEITWSSSDKYGAQLTLTDGGLYFRTNSSGTISAWQKIST